MWPDRNSMAGIRRHPVERTAQNLVQAAIILANWIMNPIVPVPARNEG